MLNMLLLKLGLIYHGLLFAGGDHQHHCRQQWFHDAMKMHGARIWKPDLLSYNARITRNCYMHMLHVHAHAHAHIAHARVRTVSQHHAILDCTTLCHTTIHSTRFFYTQVPKRLPYISVKLFPNCGRAVLPPSTLSVPSHALSCFPRLVDFPKSHSPVPCCHRCYHHTPVAIALIFARFYCNNYSLFVAGPSLFALCPNSKRYLEHDIFTSYHITSSYAFCFHIHAILWNRTATRPTWVQ